MIVGAGDPVDAGTIVQLLLALFGAGGVLGAVVALFKLKPDANSAAVTQAQGAMTTMQELNEDLKKERDEYRALLVAERAAQQVTLGAVRSECESWRQRALNAEAKLSGRDAFGS